MTTEAGSIREAIAFELPMGIRFRGVTSRQGVLLRGRHGWAEFSPFTEYDDAEAVAWLAAALESADEPYPQAVRATVPVNCTIPAVGPEQAQALVRSSSGCRTAKVKVAEPGQSLADDIERVGAVRDALGSDGRLRVDANGGWTVREAVEAIAQLGRHDLEYVEQPCRTAEELREVRGRADVPIAADESIRKASDPFRVRDLAAADVAVLKVQPLGGVRPCLRIAEQIGLPVVVSSALESSVGLASGVALAAALPELPYACGLATASMLAGDLVSDPFEVVDGNLGARSPQPDPDLLREAQLHGESARWWLDRLARCQTLLEDRRR